MYDNPNPEFFHDYDIEDKLFGKVEIRELNWFNKLKIKLGIIGPKDKIICIQADKINKLLDSLERASKIIELYQNK